MTPNNCNICLCAEVAMIEAGYQIELTASIILEVIFST